MTSLVLNNWPLIIILSAQSEEYSENYYSYFSSKRYAVVGCQSTSNEYPQYAFSCRQKKKKFFFFFGWKSTLSGAMLLPVTVSEKKKRKKKKVIYTVHFIIFTP